MKRVISLVLILVLLLSAVPVASASYAEGSSTDRADALYALGLFKGTDSGYQLEKASTRAEGLTMLIRMLGKEDEAQAGNYSNPFTDTRPWFKPYVSYAYAKGLTTGRDPVKGIFDPDTAMAAKDYCTFILRALGYDDKSGDFTWAKAVEKAEEIGLCTAYGAEDLKSKPMTRAVMVDLSYAALSRNLKGSGTKLWQSLASDGVFSYAQAGKYVEEYSYGGVPASTPDTSDDPISFRTETVATSTGNITVNIVTVDTSDSRVRVEARLCNDTLGNRKLFTDIVKESGADVVVTANFMESDADRNFPLGHLMTGGELVYCSSGLSSMGITKDGKLLFGRPSIQAWVKPLDVEKQRRHWVGMSINVDESYMTADYSVLYTHAFGDSFTTTVNGGYLVTVKSGVISAVEPCTAGKTVSIPKDGYVLYMIEAATKLYLYEHPKVGQRVELEYFMLKDDSQGFVLDDIETIVSGGPRVVTNGKIDETVDPQFTDSRFTTAAPSRTAVGRDAEGKLLLISINGCTIAQMREAMLKIGCVDCFNTDGGASSAMYVRGNYVIPAGRTLAQTIHVFVDD